MDFWFRKHSQQWKPKRTRKGGQDESSSIAEASVRHIKAWLKCIQCLIRSIAFSFPHFHPLSLFLRLSFSYSHSLCILIPLGVRVCLSPSLSVSCSRSLYISLRNSITITVETQPKSRQWAANSSHSFHLLRADGTRPTVLPLVIKCIKKD